MKSIKRRIEALEKRQRPEQSELKQYLEFLEQFDTNTLQMIAYGSGPDSEKTLEKVLSEYELQKSKKKN